MECKMKKILIVFFLFLAFASLIYTVQNRLVLKEEMLPDVAIQRANYLRDRAEETNEGRKYLSPNDVYIGDPDSDEWHWWAPLMLFYDSSLSQSIYLASEINQPQGGLISRIALQVDSWGATPAPQAVKIYMANVTDTSLPTWILYDHFTEVWSGNFGLPESGIQTYEFVLSTQFYYNGSNLAIMYARGGTEDFLFPDFLWTLVEGRRTIYGAADGVNWVNIVENGIYPNIMVVNDPDVPPNAIPNIILTITPSDPPPLTHISVIGRVLDEATETAIIGADVILNGIAEYTTTTNANGYYHFPEVLINNIYTLSITREGYETFINTDVTVLEEDLDLGTIYLTPITNETDAATIINKTSLIANYPNPFNPETTITFTIGSPQSMRRDIPNSPPSVRGDTGGSYSSNIDNRGVHVRIDIYNIKGQKVKSLIDRNMTAGTHSIVWNGADDYGNEVGSGIYYYQMKTEDYTSTRKMVMLK